MRSLGLLRPTPLSRQEPTLSTDLHHTPATIPAALFTRHRRRAWLLLAAAGWNVYVWVTRLGILLDGRNTVPFRVVHGVLILVSLAFAAAFAVIGVRMLREARQARAAQGIPR